MNIEAFPIFVVLNFLECECPRILDPVCGVDGVTYPNKCEASCTSVKLQCEDECDKCCPQGYVLAMNGLLPCEDGYAIDAYSTHCVRCKPARCEGLPLATCLQPDNPDLTCSWDNGKCKKGILHIGSSQLPFFKFCSTWYVLPAMGCLWRCLLTPKVIVQ